MITFKEHFVILENTIQPSGDLSDPIMVGEIGYGYLQHELEKINKKALKWGVQPLVLHIVKEEDIPNMKQDPWSVSVQHGTKKRYTVSIQGKAPQVEGYTFIAKLEHVSDKGNMLNFAPDSPIKNLPEIYRTIGNGCDVCGREKDRANTYILRLDKLDPKHFPNKKPGDLVQAGSICLKRFLPGISIQRLTQFAEMIEAMRGIRDAAGDDENSSDEYFTGARADRTKPIYELVQALVWAYNARGNKFISKQAAAKAGESGEHIFSTAQDAEAILTWRGNNPPKVLQILKQRPEVKAQAEKMVPEVLEWFKKTDFNRLNTDPAYSDFYHNLDLVTHSERLTINKLGFLGAAFNSYLREHRKREEVVAKDASQGVQRGYLGAVGDKVQFVGKFTGQKVFANAYGTTWLYNFETPEHNLVQWWASKDCQLQEGQSYNVKATIKIVDVNKYSHQPTTTVTRAKLTPI